MGDRRKSRVSIPFPVGSAHSKGAIGADRQSFDKMKGRRKSYGFSKVPGVGTTGPRQSTLGLEYRRPALLYFPTYQLDSSNPVKNAKILTCIKESLDENFTGHKYTAQESPSLVLRLSTEILRKIKMYEFNRYRYIVAVTLGQKRSQCYNNAITFLWDHERDTYVDEQRETTTAFIQVTVFAIYLD